MLTSRSSSHLEQGHGRFLPGHVSGSSHGPDYHHSRGGGGGGPLNFFASYSNPYENSSSYPQSHPPSSPIHTTHSHKHTRTHPHFHSHSSGSSQPTSPCLDNFSTTAWLGPVAEDEEVPVSGLHHHHRPSRTRLKEHHHHHHHPTPSPPLRLATPKRAPPSLPFSPTGTNIDDFTLRPIASIPEPLNSWFQRRKSEELELVQKRRFRPKMSPPQQQQPPPVDPRQYWGYLISPDHPTQPTPLFRNLLLSIANYMVGFLLLLSLLLLILLSLLLQPLFCSKGGVTKKNSATAHVFPFYSAKLTILACVNYRSITWNRETLIALHLKRSLGSTN